MTIQTCFDQELKKLGSGASANVDVAEGGRRLTCAILERNSLAVAFETLRLETPELSGVTKADLERIGQALSNRLTYLMEPIRPIEIDADHCVAQLRSSPPQRDDDGRSYYELVVRRGGEFCLARYRKEPGNPRTQIAANVTREVLLRLVGDFEAVLG